MSHFILFRHKEKLSFKNAIFTTKRKAFYITKRPVYYRSLKQYEISLLMYLNFAQRIILHARWYAYLILYFHPKKMNEVAALQYVPGKNF